MALPVVLEPSSLRYHLFVDPLAEQLRKTIRKQDSIRAGDRLSVAVSGGADSVALLFLMLELRAELGAVLSITHVNHKLRGAESDEDERFVVRLAQQHGLELYLRDAPLNDRSVSSSGIEAAAREQRYEFFRGLVQGGRVTKIATAHTLDDQAETVLLRLFRGTGIRGLSGIHQKIALPRDGRAIGAILRPLLEVRRVALPEYLKQKGQAWREDSTNIDVAFLRNRVRHQLLPSIAREFGDAAIEHISEVAEIARAEEEHWAHGHPELVSGISSSAAAAQPASLPTELLLGMPLATQRRLLRGWLETNAPDVSISFQLIQETLELAHGRSGAKVELASGWSLRRARHELILEPIAVAGETEGYQYALPIPGTVEVRELGICVEARLVNPDAVAEKERGQLLDPAQVPKLVVVRNWRAGDRYWPSRTAAVKKVKELLSDRHVTGSTKKMWPVAVGEDGRIVWMRGFAAPADLQIPIGTAKAIWIREMTA